MDLFLNILAAVIGYLLGTLPVGLWVTSKNGGLNLQGTGSGNIGATNVLRVFGKKAAVLTLLGDVGKGVLAVFLMRQVTPHEGWHMASGLFAVLGHIYPVTRKGKGGKGVATGVGVLLIIDSVVALITLFVWMATVLIWRFSSLGAIVAFLVLPFVALAINDPGYDFLVFSICLSALILFRHIENLKRLWLGEEPKIGASK